MKNSRMLLLLVVAIGLAIPQLNIAKQISSHNVFQTKEACEEGLKNVGRIKVGMKDSEIKELLGTPTGISENIWSYNFWPCSKPKIGAQIIVAVGISFKEKAVSEIGWETLCTMGVINPEPKKKKKKH